MDPDDTGVTPGSTGGPMSGSDGTGDGGVDPMPTDGCGCTTGPRGATAWWLLGLLGVWRRRRALSHV